MCLRNGQNFEVILLLNRKSSKIYFRFFPKPKMSTILQSKSKIFYIDAEQEAATTCPVVRDVESPRAVPHCVSQCLRLALELIGQIVVTRWDSFSCVMKKELRCFLLPSQILSQPEWIIMGYVHLIFYLFISLMEISMLSD